MKPTVISADAMFEEFRGSLRWEWLAGLGASERQFDPGVISRAQSAADLVGYLNYIHPYRVQILGAREVAYLTRGTPEDCARRIARIVTLEPPMLVLADGQPAPDELLSICERAQLPLFATRESSAFVIDLLRAYLSKHFAERTSMHGVFMDILGLGVMITGESGLGKSELGLELISRGNGLVADDAVDLYRINQTTHRRALPRAAAEPAGSARHRPAGHPRDLRRDGGAPEDAAQADRPPGAARHASSATTSACPRRR